MITLKIRLPNSRTIYNKQIHDILPPDFRYQFDNKDGIGIVFFQAADRIYSVDSGEKYIELVPASGQAEDYFKIDLSDWSEVDLE
jgi:hypothetical protein